MLTDFYTVFIGRLELIPAVIALHCAMQGTARTCHQFMTGLTYRDEQPHTFTFSPTGNLKPLFNLRPTCPAGGSWSAWREPT